MLVFLSDVHLTDGSSGQTIKPTAFKLFADQLLKQVESVSQLKGVRIVLLGDIFDIIRSTKWLDAPKRPWDPKSSDQRGIVENILNGIIQGNASSLAVFKDLRAFFNDKGIPFEIEYIIGNHDWLINRYPSCRALAAGALGLSSAPAPGAFQNEFFEPAYQAFSRHGDIYDSFNYTGNRDASSIGDAIVIELLNRFPALVEKELSALVSQGKVSTAVKTRIADLLKELDNIRPILDAPAWIIMVMNKTDNEAVRKLIEDSWEQCVDAFFKIPYIKKQDKPFQLDIIDLLQIALHLSSHTSKKILETIIELKARYFPTKIEGDYHKKAFAEPKVRSGEANFALYGHTHDQLIIPMDQVPVSDGKTQDKIYFNTGTWRKTWNKVLFDPANREFIGWHVLTYVSIFRPDENGPYNFELWNGMLG